MPMTLRLDVYRFPTVMGWGWENIHGDGTEKPNLGRFRDLKYSLNLVNIYTLIPDQMLYF